MFFSFRSKRAGVTQSSSNKCLKWASPLQCEPLEDRRLLAVVTVGNSLDVVDGDTRSIPDLIAMPGDDGISLREAILAANATSGSDEVTFDDVLSGRTILLDGAELEITESLAIDASLLKDDVTIDAHRMSRVLNFSSATGDLTLGGLVVQYGRVDGNYTPLYGGDEPGAGVRFDSIGTLTFERTTILGNSASGIFSRGGGVFARGDMIVRDSLVRGNGTDGDSASGGGIFVQGDLVATNSTFQGNHVGNQYSDGGGIASFGNLTITDSHFLFNGTSAYLSNGGAISNHDGEVTITRSIISGNSTSGDFAYGAGIAMSGSSVTIVDSLISDNETDGLASRGGGLSFLGGSVSISNSTVSGNRTLGEDSSGGGIYVSRAESLLLDNSTITGNTTQDDRSRGGGVHLMIRVEESAAIRNSIIAGNSVPEGSRANDFIARPQVAAVSIDYTSIGSLTGSNIVPSTGVGNLFNQDPLLGPLSENGGPTQTHALLAGSPAINAGDPSFNTGTTGLLFDQRGTGFPRMEGEAIDLGAYEREAALANWHNALFSYDVNDDGVVSPTDAIVVIVTGRPNKASDRRFKQGHCLRFSG